MPYVKRTERLRLDDVVDKLVEAGIQANGDLNYILYAFCKRHVDASYNEYKNFCGELHQCATEIERRILGPYEDEKVKINGDIYKSK